MRVPARIEDLTETEGGKECCYGRVNSAHRGQLGIVRTKLSLSFLCVLNGGLATILCIEFIDFTA
jgi:hypothetical protein